MLYIPRPSSARWRFDGIDRVDSMIVDPLGAVLYHGGPKEEVFTLTLQKDTLTEVRQRFPFWRDADLFSIQP